MSSIPTNDTPSLPTASKTDQPGPPEGVLCISIDAMGGDHGPAVTVEGAAMALQREGGRQKLFFLLHGDETKINEALVKFPELKAVSLVRHTDLSIAMDEKPAAVIRRRGTSLHNAINAVKTKEARAVVSAGNTGALMALSKMSLKMMIDDLERPAIACAWPNLRGMGTVLDVGANVTSDARQLMEFALMGAAFHKALRGTANPSIGLLNVGSEDVKGHDEVREAHRLLKEGGHYGSLGLNYYGFVEGDDICAGTVDVVVTDGFTGNIALKTAEGTAKFIKILLKDAFKSSPLAMLGAMLAGPALKAMSKRIDPGSANGGPLLGLNGIVVKSHGGAQVWAFSNAISVAISLAASSYDADIRRDLALLSQTFNGAGNTGVATPEVTTLKAGMSEKVG